ncbi:uncharacterized protein MONOS_17977 [Monocercomonoides exilis]|uniref:uncharacterized protein n=1 Tax=Monocercomonoides exilis TaxID=2049356 RepID=UPI00355999BE|nr:hypothetical protein MONOS_17977 [Monocercomonoides exilis]
MDGRRRYKSFHRFAKRKYYRYPGINKALLYYLRKGEESRRKTLQAVRRYGQGRVENWKQTKQTGMGLLKKRRRGRKAKIRYKIKKRKIFKKARSKYVTWLYKNRPDIYYSVDHTVETFTAYNYALSYTTLNPIDLVQIPQNQIIQMESTTPAGDDIQRSDYINYMSRYKFTFNVGPVNPGDAQRYWQVPYVRVLVFRKWGYRPNENNDLKNIIYTMFKYPELITSGYVKNFRRIWCKQWYYDAVILAGTGVQDKFNNTYGTVDENLATCKINMVCHTTNYWKYVAGMRLPSADDQETYKPCGNTVNPFSPAPRSMKIIKDDHEELGMVADRNEDLAK